jgi:hypothetical protein
MCHRSDRLSNLRPWLVSSTSHCLDPRRLNPAQSSKLDFPEEGVLVREMSVEGPDPQPGSASDGVRVHALRSSMGEETESRRKQSVTGVFDLLARHSVNLSDLSINIDSQKKQLTALEYFPTHPARSLPIYISLLAKLNQADLRLSCRNSSKKLCSPGTNGFQKVARADGLARVKGPKLFMVSEAVAKRIEVKNPNEAGQGAQRVASP